MGSIIWEHFTVQPIHEGKGRRFICGHIRSKNTDNPIRIGWREFGQTWPKLGDLPPKLYRPIKVTPCRGVLCKQIRFRVVLCIVRGQRAAVLRGWHYIIHWKPTIVVLKQWHVHPLWPASNVLFSTNLLNLQFSLFVLCGEIFTIESTSIDCWKYSIHFFFLCVGIDRLYKFLLFETYTVAQCT